MNEQPLPPDYNPLIPLKHTKNVPADMIVMVDGEPHISARNMLVCEGVTDDEMRKIDEERAKKGFDPIWQDEAPNDGGGTKQ